MEPCKCCNDRTGNSINGYNNGFGFNRLEGDAREWAGDNQMPKSEFTVPVNGGKRFGGENWQKQKCGNGRFGFPSRRQGDPVKMTTGVDGQHKPARSTTVRGKSSRSTSSNHARRVDGSRVRLITTAEIRMSARDPQRVAQEKKWAKKARRAKNRNPRARRGHKKMVNG